MKKKLNQINKGKELPTLDINFSLFFKKEKKLFENGAADKEVVEQKYLPILMEQNPKG